MCDKCEQHDRRYLYGFDSPPVLADPLEDARYIERDYAHDHESDEGRKDRLVFNPVIEVTTFALELNEDLIFVQES